MYRKYNVTLLLRLILRFPIEFSLKGRFQRTVSFRPPPMELLVTFVHGTSRSLSQPVDQAGCLLLSTYWFCFITKHSTVRSTHISKMAGESHEGYWQGGLLTGGSCVFSSLLFACFFFNLNLASCYLLVFSSAHQNPATDNPFVAKNQNLYFRGRCIWFDFKNHLVTINISTTKIQITKMPLDSLLTDIFHVVTCCK